jgi:outer membrane protein TolC
MLAVAGFVLATAAYAAEPDLTLDEAVRLAQERQPLLDAQEAGIEALRADAVASAQLPDPRLVLGVEGLPVDTLSLTRQEMTQTVLGVSQMIPGGNKLALAGRRLEHQASQSAISLAAERRRIVRDARLAWLDVYAAKSALGLTKGIESELERLIEWSLIAFKTGQITQAETFAQRSLLESMRNRSAELAGTVRRAQAGLTRWLGDAGLRPLAPLSPLPQFPRLEELIAHLDSHPEINALKAGLEAGRIDSEIARQAYKPDWSVDLAYGIRGNDRPDTLKLMVGVDLPLFPEKRQDRRLAARQAEVRQMEAMLEDRRRMLAADLAAIWADWQSADARLQRVDTSLLPLAARRTASALSAYQTGRIGYDSVLEARRAELEMRQDRLNLEVARAKAAVMLQYYE